ncbi:MAG: hypothetical protein ACAH08_10095, partial [Methylophilus sp.]
MNSWLEYKFLSFTVNEWLYTLLIFIITYACMVLIWKFSIKRISNFALRNPTKLGDLIVEVMRSTNQLTFALFSLLFAMHFLEL